MPIRSAGISYVGAVDVGASEMLSNQVRAHLQANSAVIMVLDGDQAPVEEIFKRDPVEMTDKEKREAINQLERLCVQMVGSNAVTPDTAVKHFEQWMRWCKKPRYSHRKDLPGTGVS